MEGWTFTQWPEPFSWSDEQLKDGLNNTAMPYIKETLQQHYDIRNKFNFIKKLNYNKNFKKAIAYGNSKGVTYDISIYPIYQ